MRKRNYRKGDVFELGYFGQVDGADDGEDDPPHGGFDDEEGDEDDDEDLGSELDEDEDEDDADVDHLILCQFDKVSRTKSRWKTNLKDGIMHINNRDYLFRKAVGEFEF
eukprot:Sdes_comp20836_c0_seq13m17494